MTISGMTATELWEVTETCAMRCSPGTIVLIRSKVRWLGDAVHTMQEINDGVTLKWETGGNELHWKALQ